LEDAGWVIKDTLMWLYGQGFPKATDIKKSGEKSGKNMEKWEGWKSHSLKPAWEPIIMAMKPNEGSYAENALKWGVAGLNIDGGRIPGSWNWGKTKTDFRGKNGLKEGFKQTRVKEDIVSHLQGRFPANLLLDEISAEMLDEQSGERKGWASQKHNPFNPYGGNALQKSKTIREGFYQGYNDTGGASRFFYVAKASRSERDMGLDDFEPQKVNDGRQTPIDNPFQRGETPRHNHHPTVKPLKLMEYLCILTKTPTGGIVLDPFAGSGTTCMAAKKVGRDFIGIEKELEYVKIAEARIKAIQKPLL